MCIRDSGRTPSNQRLIFQDHSEGPDATLLPESLVEAGKGAEVFLDAFGDRLERLGFSEGTSPTRLEYAALICAMRGFPRLRALAIPGYMVYGRGFYRDLARLANARPAGTGLRNLAIRELDATDECVAQACRIEGLEVLTLDGIDATRGIVDAILGGAAAASLTTLSIRYCAYAPRATALRACDVLRLVQGCPRMKNLSWFCDEEFQEGTDLRRGPCKAIVRLLKSRGGHVAMRPKFVASHLGGQMRTATNFQVLAPGDEREPEVLFSCLYDRATERYY